MRPEIVCLCGATTMTPAKASSRVLVVNPGGYLGESTSREIAYARGLGKRIDFTDPTAERRHSSGQTFE